MRFDSRPRAAAPPVISCAATKLDPLVWLPSLPLSLKRRWRFPMPCRTVHAGLELRDLGSRPSHRRPACRYRGRRPSAPAWAQCRFVWNATASSVDRGGA